MRRSVLVVAGIIWLGSVGAGMAWLWSYAATPGRQEQPPSQWPRESHLVRKPDEWTVLLFAHPHCPCTRASLGELARLLAHVQGRAATHVSVVFSTVGEDHADSTDTDLRETAAALPGIEVVHDTGGAEARRFRASTSGQTLVYDGSGHLAFAGGITGARGHEGDNPGRTAVTELLMGKTPAVLHTAVFGCSIVGAPAADAGDSSQARAR